MTAQRTLAMAAGFERHQKQTRRAEFLAQMEIVVPWRELVAEIARGCSAAPVHLRVHRAGRGPLERARL